MKRNLKAAFAAMLALCMALALTPFSALPRFEVKAEVTPSWTVPEGYNAHDYNKCVEFLEQTDENGVKNGEKLAEYYGNTYDPATPENWCIDDYEYGANADYVQGIRWCRDYNGAERKLCQFTWPDDAALPAGYIDLSGCAGLERQLQAGWNTQFSVRGLDSINYQGSIVKFNVTAEGYGTIGLSFGGAWIGMNGDSYYDGAVYAYPNPGAEFIGFFDADGNEILNYVVDIGYIPIFYNEAGNYYFIGSGALSHDVYVNGGEPYTVVARFSEGTAPTPDPSDAPVDPTDAPVDPTNAPVDPTDAPVNPTDAPVDPTDAPVDPTDAPVNPTDAPVNPTNAPVNPTEAPVNPTNAPVNPTNAPVTPNPPATGTVALAGVGVASIIGGIGAAAARRKKD